MHRADLVERQGPVGLLTMNRPDRMNAMTNRMVLEGMNIILVDFAEVGSGQRGLIAERNGRLYTELGDYLCFYGVRTVLAKNIDDLVLLDIKG